MTWLVRDARCGNCDRVFPVAPVFPVGRCVCGVWEWTLEGDTRQIESSHSNT